MFTEKKPKPIQHFDILITGAGFAGICMAIKLKELGKYKFAILEKADRVGGTWRDNHYPGAACDVPSLLYSYSFETWPNWERGYSPHHNILEYIEFCVDKYKLKEHLKLGEEVVRIEWLEKERLWEGETRKGNIYRAKIAIGSTGPLARPKLPAIPGRDSFAGGSWHTANWNHDFTLKGKRVAIIGTGASAIQVVPAIADEVGELKLFQRTPPWVIHRNDKAISKGRKRRHQAFPLLQKIRRELIYWEFESKAVAFVSLPGAMKTAKRLALRNLNKSIADPELRKSLTPSYMMGCKRVLRSDDYFPTLNKENVNLIIDHIDQITHEGILTKDGHLHKVDAIVYATGFEASENMAPFAIKGKGGADLQEAWKEGGEAYLGTTIANFPNFFIIVGPNTGLGHNSIIHIIESQVNYIQKALQTMENQGLASVEVKSDIQNVYNQKIQKRLAGTIWNVGGCMSWYLNSHGKNTTMWPGYTFEFRRMTKSFKLIDYDFEKI